MRFNFTISPYFAGHGWRETGFATEADVMALARKLAKEKHATVSVWMDNGQPAQVVLFVAPPAVAV